MSFQQVGEDLGRNKFMKIINTEMNTIEFATDNECQERRNFLITCGYIKPANRSELSSKGEINVVSTKRFAHKKRSELISLGIIDQSLCKLIPEIGDFPSNREEGEYKVKPIITEEQYQRRKMAYFRMIQEILFSRRDLNLILGKREDTDPDWYF